MKTRILAFAMVLSLAAVMVMPIAASATSSGSTTITGSVAGPTVGSIEPSSGVQGRTYSVIIGGTAFTGATSLSLGAGITVANLTVAADAEIHADITIAAGATLGARDVTVITPQGPGTFTGGFTVLQAPYINVTAPTNIVLGAMARNATKTVHGPDVSVTTNAANWQVQVTGVTSNGGYMASGTNKPTAIFQIGKDGTNWTNASDNLIYNQDDTASLHFWVQQTIDADDPAGNYSITITFTGSVQ